MGRHDALCEDPGCLSCLREERDDLQANVKRLREDLKVARDGNVYRRECLRLSRVVGLDKNRIRELDAEMKRLRERDEEIGGCIAHLADVLDEYPESTPNDCRLLRRWAARLRAAGQEPGTAGGEG